MQYYFAPMEGVTGATYRCVHHHFWGGVDKYFAPFITPTEQPRFTPRQLRDIAPEHNQGLFVVPQLLTRRAADFIWAAHALSDMGYTEVNLNLGCPSGTVVAKGKGAGFLADPDALDRFLEAIYAAAPVPVSIKTRLGVHTPEEFPRLLQIFNRYPISELIIHARVAKDFYKGQPRREAFAAALAASRNPICYNGDLYTVDDCAQICATCPAIQALMLGRGLITDPALAQRARGGAPADISTLRKFHDELYEKYCAQFGSRHTAMQRMKEFWSYHLALFPNSEKAGKRLRKATNPRDYEAQAALLLQG